MEHDAANWPDPADLPSQRERIYDREWDVLVVFDACRWDAFNEAIASSEPVRSAALGSTPHWVHDTWMDDEWNDVAYISGNPFSHQVRDMDEYGGILDDHVREHIRGYSTDSCWDHLLGTTRPDCLTELALSTEPPMVVHYLQPHTPFIGNLAISVGSPRDYHLSFDGESLSAEYALVERGLVDPVVAHDAYLDNLRLAYSFACDLVDAFDRVVMTADHGERLGPERWDHGGDTPMSLVVPWYVA